MRSLILAGDIGGTTTRLGLFERADDRPRPVEVRSFVTLDYAGLPAMLTAFLSDAVPQGDRVNAACFGVAGPVLGDVAELTNVPWRVDARTVASALHIGRVHLLNDLEAMANAVPVLRATDVHVLQEGRPAPDGNIAVIAAGTGLGEAFLHRVDGRYIPAASEAGHADFAARTEREIRLLRDLTERFGRAEVERVVSGPGLANIHRMTHDKPCEAAIDTVSSGAPALIAAAALAHRCDGCVEALSLFVEAYGAEAGNLALRTAARGGVFVGGGIAPKLLPALGSGAFMRAFRDKAPLGSLLDAIPVKVILLEESGLLGAARFAAA